MVPVKATGINIMLDLNLEVTHDVKYKTVLDLNLKVTPQRIWRLPMVSKGWLANATLKPTFTFLVGMLPSKSIEYGKIPTKKSESWF